MDNESLFIENIKKPTLDACKKYNCKCPSVIITIACKISNYGCSTLSLVNNLYNFPVIDWNGKVVSRSTHNIYNNKDACTEYGAALYRAYDSRSESIDDFVKYIMEANYNGKLIYPVQDVDDYKKFIRILTEHDFFKRFLGIINDIVYIDRIVAFVEKYNLYTLDKE